MSTDRFVHRPAECGSDEQTSSPDADFQSESYCDPPSEGVAAMTPSGPNVTVTRFPST
jgi:hypothetical protein